MSDKSSLKIMCFAMLGLMVLSASIGMSWAQDDIDVTYQKQKEERTLQIIQQQYGGEIMIASATIMGFGGFGGLLAARFSGNDIRKQVICIMIIYSAIFCKITLHLGVILYLSKEALLQSTYDVVIITTIILVAIIVICFCIITVSKHKYDSDSLSMKHISKSAIRSAKHSTPINTKRVTGSVTRDTTTHGKKTAV